MKPMSEKFIFPLIFLLLFAGLIAAMWCSLKNNPKVPPPQNNTNADKYTKLVLSFVKAEGLGLPPDSYYFRVQFFTGVKSSRRIVQITMQKQDGNLHSGAELGYSANKLHPPNAIHMVGIRVSQRGDKLYAKILIFDSGFSYIYYDGEVNLTEPIEILPQTDGAKAKALMTDFLSEDGSDKIINVDYLDFDFNKSDQPVK